MNFIKRLSKRNSDQTTQSNPPSPVKGAYASPSVSPNVSRSNGNKFSLMTSSSSSSSSASSSAASSSSYTCSSVASLSSSSPLFRPLSTNLKECNDGNGNHSHSNSNSSSGSSGIGSTVTITTLAAPSVSAPLSLLKNDHNSRNNGTAIIITQTTSDPNHNHRYYHPHHLESKSVLNNTPKNKHDDDNHNNLNKPIIESLAKEAPDDLKLFDVHAKPHHKESIWMKREFGKYKSFEQALAKFVEKNEQYSTEVVEAMHSHSSSSETDNDFDVSKSGPARMRRAIEEIQHRKRTISKIKEEIEEENNEKREEEHMKKVNQNSTDWRRYTDTSTVMEEMNNGNNPPVRIKSEVFKASLQEWYQFIKEQRDKMKQNTPYWDVIETDIPLPGLDPSEIPTISDQTINQTFERTLIFQMKLWIETYGVPALQQAEEITNLKQRFLRSNEDANRLEKECVELAIQMEGKVREIKEWEKKYEQQLQAMKEEQLKNQHRLEKLQQENQSLQEKVTQLTINQSSAKNEMVNTRSSVDISSSATAGDHELQLNKFKKENRQWQDKCESYEMQNKRLENELTRMKQLLDTLRDNESLKGKEKKNNDKASFEQKATRTRKRLERKNREYKSVIGMGDEEYINIKAKLDGYEDNEDEWMEGIPEVNTRQTVIALPPHLELDTRIDRTRIKSNSINEKNDEDNYDIIENTNETKLNSPDKKEIENDQEQKNKMTTNVNKFDGLLSHFQKLTTQPMSVVAEMKTRTTITTTTKKTVTSNDVYHNPNAIECIETIKKKEELETVKTAWPNDEIKMDFEKNELIMKERRRHSKNSISSSSNSSGSSSNGTHSSASSTEDIAKSIDGNETPTMIGIMARTKHHLNPLMSGSMRVIATTILSPNVISRKPKYFAMLDALPSLTVIQKRPAFLINTKDDPLVPCLCLFVNQGQYDKFKAQVQGYSVRSIPFQNALSTYAIAVLHVQDAVIGTEPNSCIDFLKGNGYNIGEIPKAMQSSLFIATANGQLHHFQMDSDQVRDLWLTHMETMNNKRTMNIAQRTADTDKFMKRTSLTGVCKYQY